MKLRINWAKALGYIIKYAPIVIEAAAEYLKNKQNKNSAEEAFLKKVVKQ